VTNARAELGRGGEDAAASLFLAQGFAVERNYRSRAGEIDIVARRDGLIVFCEVKTRRTDTWGVPAEAVSSIKRARLRRLAAEWLAEHRPGRVDIRFDVVSVIVRDGRQEVAHLKSAF
jgi:putative endonuclease